MVLPLARNLYQGIVIETDVKSPTGKYLYSDYGVNMLRIQDPFLNKASRVLLVGIAAGVARMALALIHILGHLTASIILREKGHFFHASKGFAEFLRGAIEAIPLIGRIFASTHGAPPFNNAWRILPKTNWWMIKIYDPTAKDLLDVIERDWVDYPDNLCYNFN